MIRACSMFVVVLCAAGSGTLLAHHGFGTFELNKSVTFTGKLTRIEFINPHSWLYFDTTDDSGKVMKHRCEMRSAHTLRRSGWSKDLFPIGQQVTIEAAPDRADPASCYLNTIRFRDGSHMDRYGQYVKAGGAIKEVRGQVNTPKVQRALRRPSGEPNLGGDWAPEQVVMRDPRGTGGGLVPLSQIGERPDPNATPAPRGGGARAGAPTAGAPAAAGAPAGAGRRGGGGPRQFGGTELTEAGAAAAAKLTQADNPRFRCETTSILFDWTFDGPVNRIVQSRDRIVLDYGQLNLKRTVHLNMTSHPANIKPTRAGHSIGRWEGDVLVVDTVGFLPGILTQGAPHSDKLHVIERFSLDPQTHELTRSYVATDPLYLKGEYRGSDKVQIADAPFTRDTCRELQFVDYSKEAR